MPVNEGEIVIAIEEIEAATAPGEIVGIFLKWKDRGAEGERLLRLLRAAERRIMEVTDAFA